MRILFCLAALLGLLDHSWASPEADLGRRLFRETRFAQFFYKNALGINEPLTQGDPVVEVTLTLQGSLPGPYRGRSISCASCHFLGEHRDQTGGGMRGFTDFAKRSPIPLRPDRGDDRTETLRNSPGFIGAGARNRSTPFLTHFDGEFASYEALTRGGLTGRNLGWLPDEVSVARAHIARVIREDREAPSYADALRGMGFDLKRASDDEVLDQVASLIAAFLSEQDWKRDAVGEYIGSPYDVFLKKNRLPRAPGTGESQHAYAERLYRALQNLSRPLFVEAHEGSLPDHGQAFEFGALELTGLKTFLRTPKLARPGEVAGNCATCHTPPSFTDFDFHNIGVSQEEYDRLHLYGSFLNLAVPTLAERASKPDAYLPALTSIPAKTDPRRADLGLWGIFSNPSFPGAQASLRELLCKKFSTSTPDCSNATLLPLTIGLFKTPTVRNLGLSAPYAHDGSKKTLPEMIRYYARFPVLARKGKVRNAAAELSNVGISVYQEPELEAFLKSLNENLSER